MLSRFVIALTNCEIGTSKIFVKVGLFELGMGKSFLSLVPDTREVRQCPERLRAGLLWVFCVTPPWTSYGHVHSQRVKESKNQVDMPIWSLCPLPSGWDSISQNPGILCLNGSLPGLVLASFLSPSPPSGSLVGWAFLDAQHGQGRLFAGWGNCLEDEELGGDHVMRGGPG